MRRTLPGSLVLAFALAGVLFSGLAGAQAPTLPAEKARPASPRPSPAAAKPSAKPTPAPVLSGSVRGPDGKRHYLCKRYPAVFDLLLRGFAPGFVRALFRRRSTGAREKAALVP